MDRYAREQASTSYSPKYSSQTPVANGLNRLLERYQGLQRGSSIPRLRDGTGSLDSMLGSMALLIEDSVATIERRGVLPKPASVVEIYRFICTNAHMDGSRLELDGSNPFEVMIARENPELFRNSSKGNASYNWCVDQAIAYLKGAIDGKYDPQVLAKVQERLKKVWEGKATQRDMDYFGRLTKHSAVKIGFMRGLKEARKPARKRGLRLVAKVG
ncbi:hypothetical protein KY360_01860 [Candidatus Woesearchaeota archaeon]|nr:hypothetical protein [Candidatus Woesearchaeota archaeon]